MRPSLAFSQLTLAIGGDGRLRAAPEVVSQLPRLTAAERVAADRIVQAALLCGPYAHPDLRGHVVSVAADFSAVEASPPADGDVRRLPGTRTIFRTTRPYQGHPGA